MTPITRKLRWGVLGYARIARESVIPGILRSGNSEFFALASRDAAKLAEARTRFPTLANTFGSYEELLRDPEVDAVYVPLPNSQHCEWTLKAAAQGKHVLCEKPIGLNAEECRTMMTACAAHGVVLMEAFMYRYTDRIRQVREVIQSGALGDVKFMEASFRFLLNRPDSIKLKPELGGGALYDVGCYPVNFAGMIADLAARVSPGAARPESVAVQCVRTAGIDELFSALLKFPSGLVTALHCGFNAHRQVGAEIVGTKGMLTVPDPWFDAAGALVLTQGEERREIPVAASDRYRAEVEDFADAVLTGRVPQFGLAESLRNMEVLDRLFAAAE